MKKDKNNYAFIDSQNLNLSIQELGWKLDFARFRVYLKEKYGVSKAFLFIGYVEDNQDLYTALQKYGYLVVFKPVLEYKNGKMKGNCDAELVLQAMIEYPHCDKAVIVTGDGDFHCLVKYLVKQDKLKNFLSQTNSNTRLYSNDSRPNILLLYPICKKNLSMLEK